MKEIYDKDGGASVEFLKIYDINIQRMNNGAHFTFVSNILARAEADTAVKGKASELVSNFKVAVAAEDEALKI